MTGSRRERVHLVAVCVLALLVAIGFAIRAPSLIRDMTGIHAWKNIRHYQFAAHMLETGNPIRGVANFTHDLTDPPLTAGHTEAPLVDWLLVVVFAAFGRSLIVFRLTWLLVNIATIVLLFGVLRRRFGDLLALVACALFTFTPLVVYFSCHSVGENLLYSATLLFAVSAARALEPPFAWSKLGWLAASCVFLGLSKLSTGTLMAVPGFAIVSIALLWHGRRRVAAFYRGHRLPVAIGGLVVLAFGLAGFIVFLRVLNEHLLVGRFPFLTREFYSVLGRRYEGHLGLDLLGLAACSLVGYTVYAASRAVARRRFSPDSFEQAVGVLLLVTLGQILLQSRPFLVHEYYSTTLVVPCLLLGLCGLKRLHEAGRGPIAVALVVLGIGSVMTIDRKERELTWMYGYENVSPIDREALRRFFEPRKTEGRPYFILSREPRWAYFADVWMLLRYDWNAVRITMRRDQAGVDFVHRLGLEYVVYPMYSIPDEVEEAIDLDPLVDLGPDHYKLGLVYRGERFMIFKITDGIAERRPVLDNEADWMRAGDAFGEAAPNDGVPVPLRSTGPQRGAVTSNRLTDLWDAICYPMHGGGDVAVDLQLDGRSQYTQRPANADSPRRFALPLEVFDGRAVQLVISDAGSGVDDRIVVGPFEIVRYRDIDRNRSD